MKRKMLLLGATLSVTLASACSSGISNQSSVAPGGSLLPAQQRTDTRTHAAVKGDVFTMSNSPGGNAILRYAISANGALRLVGTFLTGGKGSGTELNGAGHTVNFGNAGTFLFASDAGSNDIAVFTVSPSTMRLVGRFPSNGTAPASIAVSGHTLYVLNEGSNDLSGFTIGSNGKLHPIAGSTQSLTGSSSDEPVDVIFRPSGSALFVPQKLRNVIDTFPVHDGVAGPAIAHASNGTEPFGSAATSRGDIINTEASGGTSSASAVSSYELGSDGSLSLISGSVPNRQTAACWVALSRDEALAFVANTGSGTISSYSIGSNGTLELLSSVAASEAAGSAPSDIGISAGDDFLYVLNEGTHTISAFHIINHGALMGVQTVSGLPTSAIGIAVL